MYRKAIGSLKYLATNTRPDICIAVLILARRVENPKQEHWTEVKRVFRYLKNNKRQETEFWSKAQLLRACMLRRCMFGGTTLLIENQIQSIVSSTWALWYSGKAISKIW